MTFFNPWTEYRKYRALEQDDLALARAENDRALIFLCHAEIIAWRIIGLPCLIVACLPVSFGLWVARKLFGKDE